MTQIGSQVLIITDCRPDGEATGKMGIYAGEVAMAEGGFTPAIDVGEHDRIFGCECWWRELASGEDPAMIDMTAETARLQGSAMAALDLLELLLNVEGVIRVERPARA